MIKAKLIYLKDKQAFDKNATLVLLGKPIDVAKKLLEQGFGLLHVIDMDALNGSTANFDIYDKLTYLMHVEVECGENDRLIKKLLEINTRVVVPLPAEKIALEKFAGKQRLLVGKIKSDYEGRVDAVYDLFIEDATLESIKKFSTLKKRIIIYEKDYKKEMEKLVFGVIG